LPKAHAAGASERGTARKPEPVCTFEVV